MTAKPRLWKDGWYVVIHYAAKRHVLKCESQLEAEQRAEEVNKELELFGLEAFNKYGRQPRTEEIPPRTFKEQADAWLAELDSTILKATTKARYRSSVNVHLLPAFGDSLLPNIDYAALKAFCLAKCKSGLSRDSVRLMMAPMRLILEEAVREGHIPSNPCHRMGRYYGTTRKGQGADPFTKDELVALLETARDSSPGLYHFLLLSAHTGLRFGEARALTWQDIDFRRRHIIVERNWPAHSTPQKTPKGGKRREVQITSELADELKRFGAYRKRRHFGATGKQLEMDWPVFHAMDHDWLRREWKRLQRRAEVRQRNWHQLRHTYASQLLMAGANPLFVQRQLGHASLSTTLGTYSRWIDQGEEREIDRVKRVLRS